MSRDSEIIKASTVLRRGGVIAYPSESVFGLGCLASNLDAVARLLRIKGRDSSKGFILVGTSLGDFAPWTKPLSASNKARILAPCARPTTWLVPAQPDTSPLLTGHSDLIAIRLSQHPTIQQLSEAVGGALISTSANYSGEPPAQQACEINDNLATLLDFVIDAPCGDAGKPSRIYDLTSNQVLRD
ncbi:MAG: L-threonylcarbamoyladenylate synthase [bacterium]